MFGPEYLGNGISFHPSQICFLKKIHEPYILFFDFSLGSLCHCIRLACKLLWSDLGLCKFINALRFQLYFVFNLKSVFFNLRLIKDRGYFPFLSFSLSAIARTVIRLNF